MARSKKGLILAGLVLVILGLTLVWWLIFSASVNPAKREASTTPTPGSVLPSPSPTPLTLRPLPPPPVPTPTLALPKLSVPLNPQHGIHAPVGSQWTDPMRQTLAAFQNGAGEQVGPGLVVALSADMTAANNRAGVRQEEDLLRYQRLGSEIYIRMYPQRFPGGLSEKIGPGEGRNTLSGTPEDAAEDIFRFVQEQQQRTGQHFRRIIPGNEPNLEWPNANYYQNLLAWQSGDDPAKYEAINLYLLALYNAWQNRLEKADAAPFRDVGLYFPAIAQDGHPQYFAGAYFYADDQPVANKYDRLRPVIERFGRFSWHNYFRPGRACDDRAAAAFPDWLRQGLAAGWPQLISEAGWSPAALAIAVPDDAVAYLARRWQRLNWNSELGRDDRPRWRTQDEILAGVSFEDDIEYFIVNCAGVADVKLKPGVAVWLAGSDGNFTEAIGVEPGPNGAIRRWLSGYAAWKK